MKRICAVLFLSVLLFLPRLILAETITLNSGKVLEGEITENTQEYIKLKTTEGQSLYFFRNTISSIAPSGNSASANVAAEQSLQTGLFDLSDQGYLYYIPKNISSISPAPVLICLPGSGIKAKQDINVWMFPAGKKGFVVLGLDVDYNTILSGNGLYNLYSKINYLVDNLSAKYPIDKNRLYIAGTSAGGMTSIALALSYPKKFLAVGVVSGARLMLGDQGLEKSKGTLFYMVHGQKDEKISLSEFQSTRKKLDKQGAVIQYEIVPGGRHTLNSNAYNTVVNWFFDLESLTRVK